MKEKSSPRPNIPELAHYYDLAHEDETKQGSDLSRYSERVFVGEGAMKVIESAMDSMTGREVAFATVKDKGLITQFIKEARMTANLEHPNIMPVYDVGELNGTPYFTMKLNRGMSLEDWLLERSILNKRERLNLFLKICDAIAYAHSRGILHLDLKPDNIQVSDFGEVLVCDWGLSRNKQDVGVEDVDQDDLRLELTMNGSVKGTIGYMSPEQVKGYNDKRDERSDIFSLGVILYHLLSGRHYFNKGNLKDYQNFLGQNNSQVEGLDKSLQAVLSKSLSYDHCQRYTSVEELIQDVDACLRGYATGAEKAGLVTQIKLLIKRNHKVFLTVALCLIILFLGGIGFLQKILQEKNKTLIEAQKNFKLSAEAAPEFLNKARSFFDQFDFVQAKIHAKKALQLNEEDKQIRQFYALLLIGEGVYDEGLVYLDQALAPSLSEMIQSFDESGVDESQLKSLFREFKTLQVEPLVSLTVQSICANKTIDEKLAFTQKLLNEKKNKRNVPKLSYNTNEQSLKLSSSELKNLSFLSALNIKYLDLSGTTINNLKGIQVFALESLDISRTKVNQLGALQGMNLKKLNLSYCPFNDLKQLKNLSVESLDLRGIRIANTKALMSARKLKTVILTKSLVPKHEQTRLKSRLNIIWAD